MASEAGGIKDDRLLKAERLQIEADGVTNDPPAGLQVDVEFGKTDRKVQAEPRLKGGWSSALRRGQGLQGLQRL